MTTPALTPEQILDTRDPEQVEDLSDAEVVRAVDRHHERGLAGFVHDNG